MLLDAAHARFEPADQDAVAAQRLEVGLGHGLGAHLAQKLEDGARWLFGYGAILAASRNVVSGRLRSLHGHFMTSPGVLGPKRMIPQIAYLSSSLRGDRARRIAA